MWRSYNLGWRFVRLHVQHLLSDYCWLTYPNSPVALIKGYSGLRGYALILIVSEPFSSLKSSIGNKCYQNSALLPLTGNGGAGFFTHSSWHLLRRAEGVEGWSTLIFPFLRLSPSLHNSASEASGTMWSVYPRPRQSKLLSWRLHSSASQYLCLLPCLRFLWQSLSELN